MTPADPISTINSTSIILNDIFRRSHPVRYFNNFTLYKRIEKHMYYRGKKFVTLVFVVFYRYAELYVLNFSVPRKSSKVLNLL